MRDPALDAVSLTRLKVAAQYALPSYVSRAVNVEVIEDILRDNLVVRLRSEVLALRYDCQKAHRRRWWLRRLVKRRPVRTTTRSRTGYAEFDIERHYTFPDAAIRVPDNLGAPVRILMPQPMQWTLVEER